MENKMKSASGRKRIPKSEKKVAVTIWVKQKYSAEAKKECLPIQAKYQAKP